MKNSDKNGLTTCLPIKVRHDNEDITFENTDTTAKKIFDCLVERKGLQKESLSLCTNTGVTLSSFPRRSLQHQSDSVRASRRLPSAKDPAMNGEAPVYLLYADSQSGRFNEIEDLQHEFSTLLSIFYHNEYVKDFIFQGLDALPNSICIYDKSLRLLYGNSDFCNYIHIKDRSAAYGKPIEEILEDSGVKFTSVKESRDELKVKDVLKYGAPVVDWEVEVVSTKDSNEFMFASNDMYPLFDEAGRIRGVAEISRSRNKQIKQVRSALGLAADYTFEDIIGNSKPIVAAKQLAMSFAASPYNVLIYGESGVGKELFAQSIHNFSNRRSKPFVAINCASISPELIDSELFGYESGAFTGASKKGQVGKFELANGGTLFLDEVAELPLHAQTKLLRTLETHQVTRIGGSKNVSVDVRIIAATNRSLEKMIDEGLFRNDLYYRLMVLNITIPPLRDRPADILPCSDFFLKQAMRINHFGPKTIDDDAKKLMVNYDWPGNIRELRNVINRTYVMSGSSVITKEALISSLQSSKFSAYDLSTAKTPAERLHEKRLAVERSHADLLREALLICNGNKTEAAKLLDVTRKTFYNLLEKYKAFL